jgi:FkbM family methyltransferase
MAPSTNPAKKALRATVAGAMRLVPLSALVPLRSQYAKAPAGRLRRRLLRRALDVVRLREIEGVVFEVPGSGVRLQATSSQILQRVYWFGAEGYEPGESALWASLCADATSILEVGANVGYYTVHGAKAAPGVPYVAVEPHPVSAAALRRNVELNQLAHVTVIEAAAIATAASPSVSLRLPDADDYVASTGAYVATGREGDPRPAAHDVIVPALRFADLIDGVDLIKMDIEGGEHALLASAADWLRSQRPTMFIELLPGSKQLQSLLVDLVRDVGYSVYALAEGGPVALSADELATVNLKEVHRTRDLVITTRPLASNVQAARAAAGTART